MISKTPGCIRPTTSTTFTVEVLPKPSKTDLVSWSKLSSSSPSHHAAVSLVNHYHRRHTKAGGYLEFQEIVGYPHCDDTSMTDPYPVREFVENLNAGLAKLGGDNFNAFKLANEMREAGFVDVQDISLKIPLGVWPRDKDAKLAGLYMRENLNEGVKNIATRIFVSGLGWSVEKLEVFLVEVKRSLFDSSKHVYFPLRIVTGKKPLE